MNTHYDIAFTAPHFAASQTGLSVLERGGTAIEAMVAAAASIAVQYPHMNGLGGDGFWLISEPGKAPIAIDACGVAAQQANLDFYQGLTAIPSRGGKAALSMAGAVAGWQTALNISETWQTPMALGDILASAIGQAQWGIEVTKSLETASVKTYEEFAQLPEHAAFAEVFLDNGQNNGSPLQAGRSLKLPKLAATLNQLAEAGLNDFYHGDIATKLASDLQTAGSPISLDDFNQYQAKQVTPLSVDISHGKLFNLPAPTQGLASLIILALYDRVQKQANTEAEHVHLLIECTKRAFIIRNSVIADPSRIPGQIPNESGDLQEYLTDAKLDALAKEINLKHTLPWPHVAKPGDTIWMGASDNQGRMVSYIQSLYWEFGSGIVSPQTGIVWNNRGTSFNLQPGDLQQLAPGMKPFHTLNPAYAELNDGRRMVYGTMGGEGQPQTQAAMFARHLYHQQPIDEAIYRGRWLLGRTWGEQSHNLKVERDLADDIGEDLRQLGHDMVEVEPCNEMMGHAGAIILDEEGIADAASDPRSDGQALVLTPE